MSESERPNGDAPAVSSKPVAPSDAPDPIAEGALALAIHLPEFEGPLDLLLHVIQKEEIEIMNISISLIAGKYLDYIKLMQALNLDVAGEYLLMAATLAYLKSRELVPQSPEDAAAELLEEEDGVDPREALIRRLLEYQKYKEAAASLGDRPVMGRNVWGRGLPGLEMSGMATPDGAPLEEVPVFTLIEALERVLAKAKISLSHDVVVERISITDKINELVDRLSREPSFPFAACFQALLDGPIHPADLRHQIVITFMALLEMTRLKMIRLHQAADRSEIYISATSATAAMPTPTPE